jgi:hypothetical protein
MPAVVETYKTLSSWLENHKNDIKGVLKEGVAHS